MQFAQLQRSKRSVSSPCPSALLEQLIEIPQNLIRGLFWEWTKAGSETFQLNFKTMIFQGYRARGIGFLKRKTLATLESWRNASTGFEKSVYISQSTDIHCNLALEDWLYRHEDFLDHRVLLLWQNSPTVVIGRHQNIWTEVDVDEAARRQVVVARRNSGGGAVYHDLGNLNCSFFTPRSDYNRRFNLAIIQKALRKLGLLVDVNCKDDLILDGSKISGTASKLGKVAYHHCTLLVDSDLKTLSSLLNPNIDGILSRATKSKKSPVTNLKAYSPDINVNKVLLSIGQEFLQTDSLGVNSGEAFAAKQRGFQLLNPTDQWFPGLDDIKSHFKSWEWTSAKTPDFTVTKPIGFFNGLGANEVELKIVKGIIQTPTVTFPLGVSSKDQNEFLNFLRESIEGKTFTPQVLQSLETWTLPKTQQSYQ